MDEIGQVGWAGYHLYTQTPPELDILFETGGEVGCGILGSSDVVKGDLHGIEVPYAPRNGKVHRSEISDDALQIID